MAAEIAGRRARGRTRSAAEWDAMTLGEWIRSNAVNADGVDNLIECWTQPGFGADPDELSLLFVALVHRLLRQRDAPSAPSRATPTPRTAPRSAASSAARS